jgi:ubiquinone biosynthesis protein
VHIPRSYPELSTARVLTMELIEGTKLSDLSTASANGIDANEVARRGARLYLEMIFGHGFYHADPHPGNLVLMDENVIGLLDFGMVGRLDESLRDQIEEMLLAILDRDAYSLTAIIMRLGSVPPELDEATLSVELADFVDHYGNQPLEAFDLSGALREMIEVIRRYHIVLPTPLALLLKVLIMLEGTGRLLNPSFSLIEVMQPYRKQMWRRRISPVRRLKKLQRVYRDAEQLVELLPRRLMELLRQMQAGNFDVHLDHRGLEPSVNRLVLGMLASSLFLGSAFLLGRGVGPKLYDIPLLGTSGCALSLALGVRLLRAISKSGHLDRRK